MTINDNTNSVTEAQYVSLGPVPLTGGRLRFDADALCHGLADRLLDLYADGSAYFPLVLECQYEALEDLLAQVLHLVDRYSRRAWESGIFIDPTTGGGLASLLDRLTWLHEQYQQRRHHDGDPLGLWRDLLARLYCLACEHLQHQPDTSTAHRVPWRRRAARLMFGGDR